LLQRWLPANSSDRSAAPDREFSLQIPQDAPPPAARSSSTRKREPIFSSQREGPILVVLGLAACVLTARLMQIQVFSHSEFAERAQRQQVSEEAVLSRPGDVVDRNGHLLATTITVPSLFVNPLRVKDAALLSRQLADVLGLDAQELERRIQQASSKQFLWVKRRLSDDELREVRHLKLSGRLVGFRREYQRHYPQGTLAAHVLGIRNIDGRGQGGIEETQESVLIGKDGVRRFVRDARGYVLDVLEDVTEPPVDGKRVVLTLDLLLQLHVEQQLDVLMEKHKALGACAIVMNPLNGEVLALASRPTFDPNRPEQTDAAAWKNMATSAVFEPGSTFKPMVVAWGLDQGVIQRFETFNCENGQYRMGRRLLHDHHPYGELSLTDVLVKSSNIGMAKIGEQLGNPELHEMALAFGFGKRTGIELPGELSGILRPLEKWNSYSTGSIPMGQELAATPLQVISAHSVLANRGMRVTPHLILQRGDENAETHPSLVSRVTSPETADWLVQGPLVGVVRHGTGRHAQLEDVDVFGKTGTAQKLSEDGTSYSSTRNFSSFVGGADAGHPHLLVLISVDEPQGVDQYGGSVAAPYVAEILRRGIPVVEKRAAPSGIKLAVEPEDSGRE